MAEHVDRVPDLRPALRTTYDRMTLAGPGERVTVGPLSIVRPSALHAPNPPSSTATRS